MTVASVDWCREECCRTAPGRAPITPGENRRSGAAPSRSARGGRGRRARSPWRLASRRRRRRPGRRRQVTLTDRAARRTSTARTSPPAYLVLVLRAVDAAVRHADRQGGRRLRHHPRPRRVVGGVRRRAHLHLHAARGPAVVRRRAADGRGHRLHDQPLARRGVAQPLGHRRPTSRRRRSTSARSRSRRRCPTPSCRRWTSTSCPSTSTRSSRPTTSRRTTPSTASAPGRTRSRSGSRASRGRWSPTPTTTAGSDDGPPIDRIVFRRVRQRRGDGRRAAGGRDRRRPQPARRVVRRARRRRRHRRRRRPAGRLHRARR